MTHDPHPDTTPNLTAFLRRFLIVQVAVFAGVYLFCWVANLCTVTDYANGLFLVGSFFIISGVFRVFGGNAVERSFNLRYAQTAGDQSSETRGRRMMRELDRGLGASVRLFFYGIVPIIGSIVIWSAAQ
jgi:hypothetical protein